MPDYRTAVRARQPGFEWRTLQLAWGWCLQGLKPHKLKHAPLKPLGHEFREMIEGLAPADWRAARCIRLEGVGLMDG
jgi:hypothetical protein